MQCSIGRGQHQNSELAILNFNEARDDGLALASGGPDANHLHFAPYRRQQLITIFNRPNAPYDAQPLH